MYTCICNTRTAQLKHTYVPLHIHMHDNMLTYPTMRRVRVLKRKRLAILRGEALVAG